MNVSIPGFSVGTNFRTVDTVDQAHVAAAIGDIVGNATTSGLQAPSASTFEMRSYNSEKEFALQAGLSGKYLGFSASASGSINRSSSENTVAVQFYQRMFDVVVAPPQTPAPSSPRLHPGQAPQQVSLGGSARTISRSTFPSDLRPDDDVRHDLPASEQDIRATLNASYKFVTGQAGLTLDARGRDPLPRPHRDHRAGRQRLGHDLDDPHR